MLYREIIAVCSQIHIKHINTLCGQNVELLNVKLAVHIVTALNVSDHDYRGIAPRIHNFGHSTFDLFAMGKRPLVPITQKTGWGHRHRLAALKRHPCPAENRSPILWSPSNTVITEIKLSRLHKDFYWRITKIRKARWEWLYLQERARTWQAISQDVRMLTSRAPHVHGMQSAHKQLISLWLRWCSCDDPREPIKLAIKRAKVQEQRHYALEQFNKKIRCPNDCKTG